MVGLWVRFDYPQAVPVPGDTTEAINRLLLNLALDCKGETGRNIAMGFVAPSGRSIPASLPTSHSRRVGHQRVIALITRDTVAGSRLRESRARRTASPGP
jgi:hypothetical protein